MQQAQGTVGMEREVFPGSAVPVQSKYWNARFPCNPTDSHQSSATRLSYTDHYRPWRWWQKVAMLNWLW